MLDVTEAAGIDVSQQVCDANHIMCSPHGLCMRDCGLTVGRNLAAGYLHVFLYCRLPSDMHHLSLLTFCLFVLVLLDSIFGKAYGKGDKTLLHHASR